MFIRRGEKELEIIPGNTKDVVGKLDAGVYNFRIVEDPWRGPKLFLEPNVRYRDASLLDSGTFKHAVEHVTDFMSEKMYEVRAAMGSIHKLGLIFNGKPGTGKTFLAGQIAEKLVKEHDAIGVMAVGEPKVELAKLVDSLREEEPDRLICLIIDEYEKRRHGEVDVMSFLDGSNSRSNVIVIATVNSTKKLPETITNRVGRIEQIYNFDEVDVAVITKTIESIIPEKYSKLLDIKALVQRVIKGSDIDRRIDNIALMVRNAIFNKLSGRKDDQLSSENNLIGKVKNSSKKLANTVTKRARGGKKRAKALLEEMKDMIKANREVEDCEECC